MLKRYAVSYMSGNRVKVRFLYAESVADAMRQCAMLERVHRASVIATVERVDPLYA